MDIIAISTNINTVYANAYMIKRPLNVTTCVGSVEFGTGSGLIPAMKMLNVDRTKGQKGGTPGIHC